MRAGFSTAAWLGLAAALLVGAVPGWLLQRLHMSSELMGAAVPMRAILRIGLPSAGEKVGFCVCFMATMVALAVHAYAMQINGIVSMVVNAVTSGVEIIVGHKVGAGQLRGASALMRRALRICLVACGLGSLLAWLRFAAGAA